MLSYANHRRLCRLFKDILPAIEEINPVVFEYTVPDTLEYATTQAEGFLIMHGNQSLKEYYDQSCLTMPEPMQPYAWMPVEKLVAYGPQEIVGAILQLEDAAVHLSILLTMFIEGRLFNLEPV